MWPLTIGHLRSLCFYDAIGYPPTLPELEMTKDEGVHQSSEVLACIDPSVMTMQRGRVIFSNRASLLDEHEKRERLFARKIRRARWVTRWLVRLAGVRFVALCNTTAWAHANDEGDLDFFVVVHPGSLWQTRGWAALPFKILGLRPSTTRVSDAVCLSFFVDHDHLDLSSLCLPGDDTYFRHWFMSMLPLFDDGIGKTLWVSNHTLLSRHVSACPWVVHPDVSVRRSFVHLPFFRWLDPLAQAIQKRFLGTHILEIMNQDTRVVVNDHILKFHVQDGREAIRQAYVERCVRYGIHP